MRKGNGTRSFRVVRTYDPAIDHAVLAEQPQDVQDRFYRERDASVLDEVEGAVFAGESPVVFHCRPLTRSEVRDVRARPDADARERAFALCVQRVDNYLADGGSRRTWVRPGTESAKPRPLSDSELDAFGHDAVQHVGEVVLRFSFCDPDRRPYVPLRGTCLDATTAAILVSQHRHAALTSSSSSSHDDSERAEAHTPEAERS